MKNSAGEFLNALREDEEIRKYMKGCVLPEGTAREDALADVAAHFGYEVTKEELAEAIRSKEEALKAAAAETEAGIRKIPLDDLDQVAGGKKEHEECEDTFKNFENCWWEDGCDVALNVYPRYICSYCTYT